jgi:hypothetical protein
MSGDIILFKYTKIYAKEYNEIEHFKTICFRI